MQVQEQEVIDHMVCLLLSTAHDDALNGYCREVANRRAGTGEWTKEDWERNEGTAQYDLFFSIQDMVSYRMINSILQVLLTWNRNSSN